MKVLESRSKKLMEFESKALRFLCIWDEREFAYGCIRKFELIYHLSDDTVEVLEIPEENSGRDPFKLLLHKTRLPKDWKDLPSKAVFSPKQFLYLIYYGS